MTRGKRLLASKMASCCAASRVQGMEAELGAEAAGEISFEVSSPGAERTLILPQELLRFKVRQGARTRRQSLPWMNGAGAHESQTSDMLSSSTSSQQPRRVLWLWATICQPLAALRSAVRAWSLKLQARLLSLNQFKRQRPHAPPDAFCKTGALADIHGMLH